MLLPKVRSLAKSMSAVLPAFLAINLVATPQQSQSAPLSEQPVSSIWTRVPTPNIGAADVLEALSADSEQDIWAVGDFVSLRFDGTKWTAIAPVLPAQGESTLHGIAAVSPTDVWAVGAQVVPNNHLLSLIEHFDGTKWAIVPSPQFASGSELRKIFALSATDIFAVGDSHADSQLGHPLLEHFDGTKWSVVSLPSGIQNESGVLNTLAALSDSDLWLVGNGGIQGASGAPVVIHFDGTHFTPVPFPGKSLNLAGITMIATDDAWITGSDGTTLAAHWDGKTWTRVPTPTAGKSSGLGGVSAISSTNVWAAGSFHEPNVVGANLVEHFDGNSWTISPIQPTTMGGFNGLVDALAFPDGNVFLAGTELNCQGTFCNGFASVIFHTSQGNN